MRNKAEAAEHEEELAAVVLTVRAVQQYVDTRGDILSRPSTAIVGAAYAGELAIRAALSLGMNADEQAFPTFAELYQRMGELAFADICTEIERELKARKGGN